MRSMIWTLLMSFVSCVTAAHADHLVVYLLAGQSNMDGRGEAVELTGDLAAYATAPSQVRIAYASAYPLGGQGPAPSWGPLETGLSSPPKGYRGPTFGPEIGFGHALAQARPEQQTALVKFTKGGTSLVKDWKPGGEDGLAAQCIAFTRRALADLEAQGHTVELAAMLWHQGESDAGAEGKNPGLYQKAFTAFARRLRAELNAPELPIYIADVYDNAGKRDAIRAALRATAASLPHTRFIPSDGLTVSDPDNNAGGTHFDSASQIELGRRFAEAVLE